MFRSERFVQLVFADPQDIYCLPSGMPLNLNSFLWSQLCAAGCQGIYFVSGTANSCTVESKDARSFQSFENRTRGGFFKSLLGTNVRPYTPENRVTRLEGSDYQAFLKWIPKQAEQENQAFVIRLDTFCAMAEGSGGEDFLNRMTALNDRQTHSKLVLTAVQDTKTVTELLHSPVFLQKHEQGYFCRAVFDSIQAPARIPLFEELKHKLHKDAVFFNQYDQQQLTALVRCAQNHAEVLPLSEETQNAVTEYLDCWAHADSVRRQDHVFGTNRLLSYRELLQWLEDETNWKKLARCALQFRETGGRHTVEDYQDPEYKINMTMQTDLSRKAQSIPIPKINISARQRQHELCRLLCTPWNCRMDRRIKQYIYQWLTALEQETPNDAQSLECCMQALLFACRNVWLGENETLAPEVEKICMWYDELLQLHRRHQIVLERLSGIQYQNHEDMSDSTEIRFNHLITKLQQLEAAIDCRSEQLEELEDALGKDSDALQDILQTMQQQSSCEQPEAEEELLTDADEQAIQELLHAGF